jgi:uridylate kinase
MRKARKPGQTIVLSLGGSLVVPDGIDVPFLKGFRTFVLGQLRKGRRLVIIVGGGMVCRRYQAAASAVSKLTRDDVDWLGIHSTRLNAHLIRTVLRDVAHPQIVKDPTQRTAFRKGVLVAAGWKPGFSTDYDAVMLAKRFRSGVVINLSNVDYAYDKDPKYHKDAKPLERLSWPDFRRLVGNRWDPGLNAPFDPVASREAQRLGLSVLIAGRDLENVKAFLDGKPFRGTLIS